MARFAPPRTARFGVALLLCGGLLSGCQLFVDDADREVYRLIEKRQQEALGETRQASIDAERSPEKVSASAYEFVPDPLDMSSVEAFQPPASQPAEPPVELQDPASRPAVAEAGRDTEIASTQPQAAAATQPAEAYTPTGRVVSLADILAYAFQSARAFQTAKEELYLAALALSLERHLWTPQFKSDFEMNYTNDRKITTYDHALEMVARAGVAQRLPFGGEVSAQVINTLMHDLTNHVTSAETGEAILAANIPLLRGAGMVAMESRFQAERDLIYAVRAFERFRQVFAVSIAADYLELQQLRQVISNARESTKIFTEEVARARAFKEKERLTPLEVQRAEQNQLFGFNRELDAAEDYRSSLDAFKIRIGMPVEEEIDVEPQDEPGAMVAGRSSGDSSLEEALEMPAVDESDAIRLALKYRLDLLNDHDRIADAERGINIAENHLLPDLQATGSVTFHTDPNITSSYHYNVDRATWETGLKLEIPLDRKAERNDLRKSQIVKRQAERRYSEAQDTVRLQVRQAMRRVELERSTLEIQVKNRDLALLRRSHARFLFDRGKVSNREVVDAEDALLIARNRLAQAQASVRLAILQFCRDTGTLRLDDHGQWNAPVVSVSQSR